MYKKLTDLSGKRALVTGGGRGIGLCAADALAEAGACVVIVDLSEQLLEEGLAFLRSKGHEVEGLVLDVSDSDATERVAEEVETKSRPMDILIANAGISGPDTPAENLTDEAWHRIMKVNLDGVFWSCRAFGKRMLERRHGAIVTVGSMSGFISNKPQKQVDYNASKAALHHLTRSLAGEWADRGVRVNGVAPTYVNTLMSNITAKNPHYFEAWMEGTPMRRMIEPEEVAAAILFLASPAASAITGAILPVDAGYTIW